MAVSNFTEAYDKLQSSTKSYVFHSSWKDYLSDQVYAKLICAQNRGFNPLYAKGPDKLRKKMSQVVNRTEGEIVLEIIGVNPAGTQVLTAEQAKAAASVKLLRHLYFAGSAGAQSVWIYSPPATYTEWVFDEIKNKTAKDAKASLDHIDEVYSKDVRKHMHAGIMQARSWADKCVLKLTNPDATTKAMVKRWFYSGALSDAKETKLINTLKDGFRSIVNTLKANRVVFSDEPDDRHGGGWGDYAFVLTGERLDAVYIQGATLAAWSNAGNRWVATLAVIHELSHRLAGTDDSVYDEWEDDLGNDVGGLKPGGMLTLKHTVVNADSWAYFCADLNGCLTMAKRNTVYRVPTEWDSDYDPLATPNF